MDRRLLLLLNIVDSRLRLRSLPVSVEPRRRRRHRCFVCASASVEHDVDERARVAHVL